MLVIHFSGDLDIVHWVSAKASSETNFGYEEHHYHRYTVDFGNARIYVGDHVQLWLSAVSLH